MQRPDSFEFSLAFLGGDDADELRAYVERLEAESILNTALIHDLRERLKAHETPSPKRVVGRPKGRICGFCKGEGHLQPSHGLDYRTCAACNGAGRV